ncbi:hypothetical protein F4695_002843 [Rhizobium soli]|uniref:Uncharacterized protein n=1 Tax=Rhizobium soli TaxID=424798 RepID=A0A7X0JLL1_9HYPH|nr:hypothetical protein [Rhizobium soli]MBB6509475.1 hypothetical protein [Rhizobium soli]
MVQVTTISASMAALAIETLRTPPQLSVKARIGEAKRVAERASARNQSATDPTVTGAMTLATSLSLDFLDAGQQPPQQQASLQMAEAAYRDTEE